MALTGFRRFSCEVLAFSCVLLKTYPGATKWPRSLPSGDVAILEYRSNAILLHRLSKQIRTFSIKVYEGDKDLSNGLRKTSCDVGMFYGKLRANSVRIRHNRNTSNAFRKTLAVFC